MPPSDEEHLRSGKLQCVEKGPEDLLLEQLQKERPRPERAECSRSGDVVEIGLNPPDVALHQQKGVLSFLCQRLLDAVVGILEIENRRVALQMRLQHGHGEHGGGTEMVEVRNVRIALLFLRHGGLAGNEGGVALQSPQKPSGAPDFRGRDGESRSSRSPSSRAS
jgi:hypothetical protein